MSVLRRLAHLTRATFWVAVHLSIATGLLLLSAYLFTQEGEDHVNGGFFLRVIGAIWLYAATYSFVARGILQVPARPPQPKGEKPAPGAKAKDSLGCVLSLLAIPVTFVVAGRAADWAWAGISGPDASHPARVAADGVLYTLQDAGARPDVYAPSVIGILIAMSVLRAFVSRAAAPRPATGRHAQQGQQRQRSRARAADGGAASGKRRGAPVSESNASALATAAVAATARTTDNSSATSEALGSRSGTREDRVLGSLFWSPSDGAWLARRHDATPDVPIRIEADPSGPTTHQIDLARGAVQRSFEILLRGSEPARLKAQAKGVGLPRFTIGGITVGTDAGAATPITLHMRCEGDPGTDYAVHSTDGMHTFRS